MDPSIPLKAGDKVLYQEKQAVINEIIDDKTAIITITRRKMVKRGEIKYSLIWSSRPANHSYVVIKRTTTVLISELSPINN